jgi:ATP-binding cassette subfamily F protein 3
VLPPGRRIIIITPINSPHDIAITLTDTQESRTPSGDAAPSSSSRDNSRESFAAYNSRSIDLPSDDTTADHGDSPYPPPAFSSLYFPPSSASQSNAVDPNKPVAPAESLPAFSALPPPLQGSSSSPNAQAAAVLADTKAALPRDTKDASGKEFDDGEPPPPYSEGSSPLAGFYYVMASAGGPASIITQVSQGGGGGAGLGSLGSGKICAFDMLRVFCC